MTELETMQRAKMYIDKLAQGINPIDDTVVPEDDIINNVRLSRCLFYVSDIIKRLKEMLEASLYFKRVPLNSERSRKIIQGQNLSKREMRTEYFNSIRKYSFENQPDLIGVEKCGCFYCMNIFKPEEITTFRRKLNT